jgi:hypothetical protein
MWHHSGMNKSGYILKFTEDAMIGKVDKGRSILNAADETANPYGLILSEEEREFIYGELISLDNMTNALLYGRTGWKQQVQATLSAGLEFVGVGGAVTLLHYFLNIPMMSTFTVCIAFIILQKLDLLLTHERIDDTHARRNREDEKEAKERAQYFKDMGCKDMSLRDSLIT